MGNNRGFVRRTDLRVAGLRVAIPSRSCWLVHGLIFFYMQKFADLLATATATHAGLRSSVVRVTGRYLPSGSYDDADAVAVLQSIADGIDEPLPWRWPIS